jgi:hypothetical protein
MQFLINFKAYFIGSVDIQVFCEHLCMDQVLSSGLKTEKVWAFMLAEVEVNTYIFSSPDQF